jgi:hypothetical protein
VDAEKAEDEAKTWCGLEPGKVKPGRGNNPAQVGFDVKGPVVLLGTPADNPLIDFLAKKGFLPYQPDAAAFPGPGRGMLAWQLDGIGYGQESITLIAYDAKGMGEAVGTLYEAATGLRPLTRWRLPEVSSITAATKTPARPPEGKVVWKKLLPDRVAAVKALPGGSLLILTQDGLLQALDKKGNTLWQATISGGDAWALDVSADGKLIAVGASQRLLGFDVKGKQLFEEPLTGDQPVPVVTFVAVSPDGKHVAAGAGNGKLTLVDAAGKRLWSVGGVNPNDKNVLPNPYLAGLFTADSKALVVLTQNEAHGMSLADGKVTARTGGVSGSIAPQRVGTYLLLGDGNSASLYAPGENKVIKRTALPKVGVVSLAAAGDDLIIGGEIDGTVARVKTAAANPREQVAWESKTPGRLVKQVAALEGQTAVAYWGGLVRVFDASGAVKAARTFPQDVAALVWSGDRLVVALADGQVIAAGFSR